VTELPDGSPIQSHQPMLTATRALLAARCDPETPLEMQHDGSPHVALTSTVGIAAKLTVKADDRLHRYNAFSRPPCRHRRVFKAPPLPRVLSFVPIQRCFRRLADGPSYGHVD
jgi:hypothetical protein